MAYDLINEFSEKANPDPSDPNENDLSRAVEITEDHFAVNFLTHADFEFTAGSEELALLAELGVSTLRYPGGSITEQDFTEASFLTGDWTATSSPSGATLTPFSQFFAAASEIGAEVQLVIPTRVAFQESAGQALANGTYGTRTTLDPDYLDLVYDYIDEALLQAQANGVTISTFEIGNEFWGSGQMTAVEYGQLAAILAEELDAAYPGIDIIVQATSAANTYSPNGVNTVYLEPIYDENGVLEDYAVHDTLSGSLPSGWIETTIASQGNARKQTEDIADALAANSAAQQAVDGVVGHSYFGDGLEGTQAGDLGIDGENSFGLRDVFTYFTEHLGRTDIENHITEWAPNGGTNDLDIQDMKYAQSMVEVFYELVSNGVDSAVAFPLTWENDANSTRNLIDTSGTGARLTMGGATFQMLQESTIGTTAIFDYDEDGEIDVHGFSDSASRLVMFAGERSGAATYNVELNMALLDLGDLDLNDSYFIVTTQLSGTDNTNPIWTYDDMVVHGSTGTDPSVPTFAGGGTYTGELSVSINMEAWGLVRIEVTQITDGDDELIGRDGDDTIEGAAGDDTISGGDGNDSIFGNEDRDSIDAGDGDDTVFGGTGLDTISGGLGNDELVGGTGSDSVKGDEGDDLIYGRTGYDTLRGGSGNDTIYGEEGRDEIYGFGDHDSIDGGTGNDIIWGGNGQDTILGDDGNDTIEGEAAQDSLKGGNGDDTVLGGGGADIVKGNDGNDSVSGDGGDDEVHGQIGNDTISGGSGDDTLIGGADNDTMTGGGDADLFKFNINSHTGDDVVTDFTIGTDQLWMVNATYSDMTFVSVGSDVRVEWANGSGSGSVHLNGVGISELSSDDFLFT